MSALSVLTTLLLSGITAAFCTFYLNERKERWQLRRQKIEDIYVGADSWTTNIALHHAPWFSVIRGELTVDQINELTISTGKNADSELMRLASKLQMNVLLYEPSLNEQLNTLLEIRDQLSKIAMRIKGEYRTGDIQLRERKDELRAALHKWTTTSDLFQAEIIKIGRSIAEEPSQVHTAAASIERTCREAFASARTRLRSLRDR